MNNRIQKKLVSEALSQHLQSSKTVSKKFISTLMSVCTAIGKPNNNLSLEQWQHLEFKKSKSGENYDHQDWGL